MPANQGAMPPPRRDVPSWWKRRAAQGGMIVIGCVVGLVVLVRIFVRPSNALDSVAARHALGQMFDCIHGAKAFSVTLMEDTCIFDDKKGAFHNVSTHRLEVQHPNKLRLVLASGLTGLNLVSDGRQVFTNLSPTAKYTLQAAPASVEDVLGEAVIGRIAKAKIMPFVCTMLSEREAKSFLSDFVPDNRSRQVIQNGLNIITVTGVNSDGAIEIVMTDDGRRTLPTRMVIHWQGAKNMVTTLSLSEWALNPVLGSSLFTYDIPKDGVLVELLPNGPIRP